jgi:hypothetical protein
MGVIFFAGFVKWSAYFSGSLHGSILRAAVDGVAQDPIEVRYLV